LIDFARALTVLAEARVRFVIVGGEAPPSLHVPPLSSVRIQVQPD
jgi:hypothetical protein